MFKKSRILLRFVWDVKQRRLLDVPDQPLRHHAAVVHVFEVRAEGRVAGVALVAPPNHPDGGTLVVDGNVSISLVILAELDQVVEGAAGLAALRLGQLDAEVVVVFVLLEAADIGRATDRALLGGCLVSGIAGLDVDVAGFPGDAVGFRQLFRSQRRRLRDAFPIESACLVSSR